MTYSHTGLLVAADPAKLKMHGSLTTFQAGMRVRSPGVPPTQVRAAACRNSLAITVYMRPRWARVAAAEGFDPCAKCVRNFAQHSRLRAENNSMSDYGQVSFLRHFHYRYEHKAPPEKMVATPCDIVRRHHDVDFDVMEEHAIDPNYEPQNIESKGSVGFSSDTIRHQLCGGGAKLPKAIPGVEMHVGIHRQGQRQTHHAGLIGVSREQQASALARHDGSAIAAGDAVQSTTRKVHGMHGTVVGNHPEWPESDYMSVEKALDYTLPLEEAKAFDGWEVFNDTMLLGKGGGHREAKPLLRWVERNYYERGLDCALVAGTDEHGNTAFAPHLTDTIALVNKKSEAGLVDAIRHARTYVTTDRQTRLSKIAIDNVHQLGSHPKFIDGTKHRYALKFHGIAPGSHVQLVQNGKVVADVVADKRDFSANLAFEARPVTGKDYGYVYVRVSDRSGATTLATSAVVHGVLPRPGRSLVERATDKVVEVVTDTEEAIEDAGDELRQKFHDAKDALARGLHRLWD